MSYYLIPEEARAALAEVNGLIAKLHDPESHLMIHHSDKDTLIECAEMMAKTMRKYDPPKA